MLWYVLKLLVVLPLIGVLAWGSLRLAKRLETRIGASSGQRSARVIETQFVAPGLRLAVIQFHDREILVAAGKNGMERLAEVTVTQPRAREVQP